MTTIFQYPGQGSQKVGMGQELFAQFPDLIQKANSILGYSISALCLEGPASKLAHTQYTQVAIFIVNALSSLKKINFEKIVPDYLIGHSIGEYNALLTAGVFDFETGVTLVKKRAELMARALDGGMAAVVGLDPEKIRQVLAANSLNDIDLANFNAPDQIVISGPKTSIGKAQTIFEKNGAKLFLQLPVGGAFHSRYMRAAAEEFKTYLSQFTFSKPKIPVIANVNAQEYSDVAQTLAQQLDHPVLWSESIIKLLDKPNAQFYEVGHGTILTGLLDKIKKSKPQSIYPQVSEKISPKKLGSSQFIKDHRVKYAYVAGAMVYGIASAEMVIKMSRAGILSFFGTGGLSIEEIEKNIVRIQSELGTDGIYGFNFLSNINNPMAEEKLTDLYLKYGIKQIEASAFMQITPALVRYRVSGLSRDASGRILAKNKLMAKLSRPEVAEMFMKPPPDAILSKLVNEGKISSQESEWAKRMTMADDICVEADSGGHTDKAVATAVFPAMLRCRNQVGAKHIRLGLAGGIGTPEAVASAFLMGADFVLTGSINQCSVESGTSDAVKDLLEKANVQDMEMAPAGDMFELGARVQVFKRGLFFPARANKLYDLFRHHQSWESIDAETRNQIEKRFFKKTFEEVWTEVANYLAKSQPAALDRAKENSKVKMVHVFRWYFHMSNLWALQGSIENKVDFQIHCGPALGAFNQCVKGTRFESWRNRHTDEIADYLMSEAVKLLEERISQWQN